ncbi:tyrosine-protein phosphatase [Nocardioides sp.]|uniref:tyrosine-protein phosphatase n=1 Tax=Nocardioides sp. TaxID=35761 RepID=UPI00262E3E03|nr:tyrosine-protein phosphatase [Nocardioides sp.]
MQPGSAIGTSSGHPGLPDLANLRDVGGLATYDAHATRHGQLLRSATPHFLDAYQAAVLVDEVGLRLRIDLRSRGEIAGATSTALAWAERTVLLAPLRSGGREAVPDLDDPTAAMVAHYLRFLDHSRPSFAAIVTTLTDADQLPALVHCTMGKDRTGVVLAVLLSAVGVRDEEVVADYALTSEHTAALLERLGEIPGYAERLAALPAESLGAVPETMVGFLAGLRRSYGDARAFLRTAGVSDRRLDELTALLVG